VKLDELRLILVPTDFSEASAVALRTAIRLAQRFLAEIEIFHANLDPSLVLPPPADVVVRPGAFERARAEAAEQLDRAVEEVRAAGVPCTGTSEVGRSDAAIVDRARRSGAGLIVMGTHGRRGLSHVLVGSVAEKVVEHARCPVLVVPAATPA
jgi:nucleotide-binding universal stress UspA family protein